VKAGRKAGRKVGRRAGGAAPMAGGDGATGGDGAIRTIEATIRRFLAGYRPRERRRGRPLSATVNLWTEVNSLTMLQLVAFVEQKFAIQVRPIDFAPQNFSSVAAIARFVAARLPPAADRSDRSDRTDRTDRTDRSSPHLPERPG
jgi:acyl carrier protein